MNRERNTLKLYTITSVMAYQALCTLLTFKLSACKWNFKYIVVVLMCVLIVNYIFYNRTICNSHKSLAGGKSKEYQMALEEIVGKSRLWQLGWSTFCMLGTLILVKMIM